MNHMPRLLKESPAMIGPYAQYFLIAFTEDRTGRTLVRPVVCLKKREYDTDDGPKMGMHLEPIGEEYVIPTDRLDRRPRSYA